MAKGRKPDPAGVREQKDAVRSKHAPAPQMPEPAGEAAAVDRLAAPDWLKGKGLEIWGRLSPRMTSAKLLTSVDAEVFARYCRNFARWLKLHDELDREGETYETETYGAMAGGEGEASAPPSPRAKLKRAHPAFLIADRIERQLLAAEDRFGLNPAERQRIYAARSQSGMTGDLFEPRPPRRPEDPAIKPTEAAQPGESPIGLLN